MKKIFKSLSFKERIHSFYMRSGWVCAFVIFSWIFYENELKNRDQLFTQLMTQLQFWEQEKEKAILEQQDLEAQMNSQSDLAWIELTLIKGLGLVPEGQQKVYFYPTDIAEKN